MTKRGYIVLDLDQTLISAEASDEYDFKKNKEKAKKFVFHDMDGYYMIFERPGVQSFLTYIFANFDVSIWTAASKDYALFIVDKIIIAGNSNRKLDYIFFSYHCDVSKHQKKGSKDLKMMWDVYKIPNCEQDNCFILDDYSEVYKTQIHNCVIAIPFEFTKEGSENDKFLEDLTTQLRILNDDIKAGKKISDSVDSINKNLKSKSSSVEEEINEKMKE